MDASQVYILIAILGLLLIGISLFILRKNKRKSKLTPLTNIAFLLIIFGIFFNNRIIAYTLFGLGMCLAIIDAIIKSGKRK